MVDKKYQFNLIKDYDLSKEKLLVLFILILITDIIKAVQ